MLDTCETVIVTHFIRKFPTLLWNPCVHNRIHKSLPFESIPSYISIFSLVFQVVSSLRILRPAFFSIYDPNRSEVLPTVNTSMKVFWVLTLRCRYMPKFCKNILPSSSALNMDVVCSPGLWCGRTNLHGVTAQITRIKVFFVYLVCAMYFNHINKIISNLNAVLTKCDQGKRCCVLEIMLIIGVCYIL